MVRFSNSLIGVLNVITLVLSIPIIGGGIWLSQRANTDCEKFLERPLVALGVFLFLVSLAGFVGACCRNSCLLWLYLVVMFLLILLLVCFTVFAFVVTNKGAGEVVSGRGFKEYRLGDYSDWLQRRVEKASNWRRIRSCLQQGKVCESLQNKNQTWDQFVKDNLSPIQSGCCKPPSACNFTFMSGTAWNKPPGFNSSDVPDCNTWQNGQSTLCYDCQSCKAGVLANLKHDWKKVAVANIVFLIFLVVVYSIGCCAFRNNRDDNHHPRYK
ncbi:Tetraspanin family [Musa troglodytarum]|uniref:Tetraspanin family n=1 Tax=Musa troglodytarum TaxID=320322 RepID=A0A9E7JVE0_9LILI|nr:Tetraspanin family [Musa troglodytarum]